MATKISMPDGTSYKSLTAKLKKVYRALDRILAIRVVGDAATLFQQFNAKARIQRVNNVVSKIPPVPPPADPLIALPLIALPVGAESWNDIILALIPNLNEFETFDLDELDLFGNVAYVRGSVTDRDPDNGNPTGETRAYVFFFEIRSSIIRVIFQHAWGG